MIQAYNFLGESWQLFPEKGIYESGDRPKSGFYKIESNEAKDAITISHNWVTLENDAFAAQYSIKADGHMHPFENKELADQSMVSFTDTINFDIHFYRDGQVVLHVMHHILPNGYLKITLLGSKDNTEFSKIEIYHKQMSVLPYSTSVSGAVIKPTKEGVIKHKALTAMEEQTNMQLNQIRKQIELLAMQAQEMQKRKELSLMVYAAKLSFKPIIGQTYYLYSKHDDSFVLSLISPTEWGGNGPFKSFEGAVRLLADHTWMEM